MKLKRVSCAELMLDNLTAVNYFNPVKVPEEPINIKEVERELEQLQQAAREIC